MRRGRIDLLQHAHDLGELGHQVGFVLQPSGRVDQQHIDAFRAGAFERLEGDAGRIGADLLGDHLRANALAPHFELIDGRGAERVGGGEHDAQALALELMRHLGGGGGLAGAVHPDHQEHMRAACPGARAKSLATGSSTLATSDATTSRTASGSSPRS